MTSVTGFDGNSDKSSEIEEVRGKYADDLPSSEKQTCSKCTYFTPTEEGIGECRRYPPIPIVHFYESTNATVNTNSGWLGAKIVSTFPSVYAESLCGEYYAKEWSETAKGLASQRKTVKQTSV